MDEQITELEERFDRLIKVFPDRGMQRYQGYLRMLYDQDKELAANFPDSKHVVPEAESKQYYSEKLQSLVNMLQERQVSQVNDFLNTIKGVSSTSGKETPIESTTPKVFTEQHVGEMYSWITKDYSGFVTPTELNSANKAKSEYLDNTYQNDKEYFHSEAEANSRNEIERNAYGSKLKAIVDTVRSRHASEYLRSPLDEESHVPSVEQIAKNVRVLARLSSGLKRAAAENALPMNQMSGLESAIDLYQRKLDELSGVKSGKRKLSDAMARDLTRMDAEISNCIEFAHRSFAEINSQTKKETLEWLHDMHASNQESPGIRLLAKETIDQINRLDDRSEDIKSAISQAIGTFWDKHDELLSEILAKDISNSSRDAGVVNLQARHPNISLQNNASGMQQHERAGSIFSQTGSVSTTLSTSARSSTVSDGSGKNQSRMFYQSTATSTTSFGEIAHPNRDSESITHAPSESKMQPNLPPEIVDQRVVDHPLQQPTKLPSIQPSMSQNSQRSYLDLLQHLNVQEINAHNDDLFERRSQKLIGNNAVFESLMARDAHGSLGFQHCLFESAEATKAHSRAVLRAYGEGWITKQQCADLTPGIPWLKEHLPVQTAAVGLIEKLDQQNLRSPRTSAEQRANSPRKISGSPVERLFQRLRKTLINVLSVKDDGLLSNIQSKLTGIKASMSKYSTRGPEDNARTSDLLSIQSNVGAIENTIGLKRDSRSNGRVDPKAVGATTQGKPQRRGSAH